MDRIGLVGLSWRQGGPEALARFGLPAEGLEERLMDLADEIGAGELVYLGTCNRVEVAFVAEEGVPLLEYRPRLFRALCGEIPEPGEAERSFRAWGGEGAVEHLFCVCAGLDSARVGETDVANQVRGAFELARRAGTVGVRLGMVFEAALKIARRVHRDTGLDEGRESLAEIGLDHLRARLARTPGRVALVGVSPMTERCSCSLKSEGHPLILVNRALERARALERELGGGPGVESRSLEEFRERPDEVEALLLATGSPEAVLDRGVLERLAARAPSGTAPLIVDMAVPPDVSPDDARAVGCERVGMEEILAEAEQSRERRLVEMAEARAVIDEALIEVRRRLTDRLLSPLLAAVQRRYRTTALEGVERLLRRELGGLEEGQREAVRRWAETLARRFAHLPTAGLREVAVEGGSEAVAAFFSHADEALAADLRAVAQATETLHIPRDE